MLTIPDEIKELLHQDTCRKNIRIHFPNGERSDICNGLIVKDSVKFTESLNSRDSIKFGLCESPVFECETVGVGNIKGAKIEVSCEIFCDSTVSGAIFQTDLQVYVYPIPYGTFVVSESKRQADMIHRRILAYQQYYYPFVDINQIERGYKSITTEIYPIVPYTPSQFLYTLISITTDFDNMDIFDKTEITGTDIEYNHSTSGNLECHIRYKLWKYDDTTYPRSDLDNIFYLYGENVSDPTLWAAFVQYLQDHHLNVPQNKNMGFVQYNTASSTDYQTGSRIRAQDTNTNRLSGYEYGMDEPFYFYGYFNDLYTYIYVVKDMYVIDTNTNTVKIETGPLYTNYKLYKYALKSAYSGLKTARFSIPGYRRTNWPASYSWFDYSVLKNDFYEYVNAYVELLGLYANKTRNNESNLIDIRQKFGLLPESTLYPGESVLPSGPTGGSILPQDYQSCWYDDEYIKPFGAIRCEYTNTDDDKVDYLYFLTGYDEDNADEYQLYDISQNKAISENKWTDTAITAICSEIASKIGGVTYMPVEFVGRGLPYVEPGDTFEILTKSNDSITTIVLNRTISGEQTLTDSYKSV